MTRIITIMNQQSSVGKTTTAHNLGHALALLGNKVTVLDLDPDGQLTRDYDLQEVENGLDAVLLENKTLDDVLVRVTDNFNFVPAGEHLADYEALELGGMARAKKLKKAIDNSTMKEQDFILIDCPARQGLLTLNAMHAADDILIPTVAAYSSVQGLARVAQTFKRLSGLIGSTTNLWLVFTRMKMTNSMSQEIKNKILAYFPGRVLKTAVRENNAVMECRGVKDAIFNYQRDSVAAEDYFSLAQDILDGRTS